MYLACMCQYICMYCALMWVIPVLRNYKCMILLTATAVLKQPRPSKNGHRVAASDLPTIMAFSVNFRFRKLCAELHVTNLHTVLSASMFVTSASFTVRLAMSPCSESEQNREAIVIVTILQTFSFKFQTPLTLSYLKENFSTCTSRCRLHMN
jgi:hypothetical protein